MISKKDNNLFFEEEQQFRQKWLWSVLLIAVALPLVLNAILVFVGQMAPSQYLLTIAILVPVETIVIGGFYLVKFQIRISETGIETRWFPFQRSFRLKRREDISEIYFRKSPFMQYGFRWVPTYGWVTRVNAKNGIQLIMKNGRRFFIGIENISGLQSILEKIFNRSIRGFQEERIQTDRF